jgi:hypothetical protein
VPREDLTQVPAAHDLLTLEEAARESGLSPSTLRVQLNHGRLKGEKRGRDWFVDAAALFTYLDVEVRCGRDPTREGLEHELAPEGGEVAANAPDVARLPGLVMLPRPRSPVS